MTNQSPLIIPERLAAVTVLYGGAHERDSNRMCVMEAAAWIAGEPWSDRPVCVCPILAAFCRAWNDCLRADRRTEILLPLLPRLVGTRGDVALIEKRIVMAADWFIRIYTPAWLWLAGLPAEALEALPEIASVEQVLDARGPLDVADREVKWAASKGPYRTDGLDAAAGVGPWGAWHVGVGFIRRNAAETENVRRSRGIGDVACLARDVAWRAQRVAEATVTKAVVDEAFAALLESAQALLVRMIEAEV